MSEKTQINQLKARVYIESRKRGMPASGFAKSIGKLPQNLDSLLNHNNPRIATVRMLASAFGMTEAEFLQPVTFEEYGEVMIPRM